MKYLFILFIVSFLIQQIYHWYFFAKFSFFKIKEKEISNQPVSVVICGKNEEDNFKTNIPKITEQAHPNFEIVIVDDHSTDNTPQVLQELQQEYANITVVSKENVINRKGKKQALFSGVQYTKNDIIVVTDADCTPTSHTWLQQMAAAFINPKIELVLGLAPNDKEHGFWRGLFRYETYFTATQYISFALNKMPYMGVGRNMAYRKSFFTKYFPTVLNGELSSGDDDLLVNLGANKEHTALVFHPDAYTLSPTPQKLRKWFRQKTRHLSAGFEYKTLHKILLIGIPFSAITFFITGITLVLFSPVKLLALMLLLMNLFVFSIIHTFGLRKFYCDDLVGEASIYNFIWFIFTPIIAVLPKFKKTIKWN